MCDEARVVTWFSQDVPVGYRWQKLSQQLHTFFLVAAAVMQEMAAPGV